jgi:hypothetical protein
MKNIFLILFLIPFITHSQNSIEYKLQKSFSDQEEKNCISKMDCFYSTLISNDDDDVYYTLYYSYGNENWQAIDSVDPAGFYESALYSFQNETENSYVVLWENDSEYNPFFYIYYLSKGNIVKIGVWGIHEPPGEVLPDYLDYSVEDIQIHQKNNEIEFLFLKNVTFAIIPENYDFGDDDWGTFKAGELKVSFNIVDETVKRVIEKE